MRAFLQRDSSKKKTDKKSKKDKNGFIHQAHIEGKSTYLNSIKSEHLKEDGSSLRNIIRSYHNAPDGIFIKPIYAPVNSEKFSSQVKEYSIDISKAMTRFNKEAHLNNINSKSISKIPFYEFVSTVYSEDFDWIEDDYEKAEYQRAAAIETLELLCENSGGTNRMFTINVHNEKTKSEVSDDNISFENHSHNWHTHVLFTSKDKHGYSLNIPEMSNALRCAAARTANNFKYRFKFKRDEFGEFIKDDNGIFIKEYLLDKNGNKIPFVRQDDEDFILIYELNMRNRPERQAQRDVLGDMYKKVEQRTLTLEAQIMELIKDPAGTNMFDQSITNIEDLNLRLSEINLPVNLTTRNVRNSEKLEKKKLTVGDWDSEFLPKSLKNILDRISQQTIYEMNNNVSIDQVRIQAQSALFSLKPNPSYKDLQEALKKENLRLAPKIKTNKTTGEKYVDGGVVELLDSGLHMRLSWIPNLQWMSIQELLAIEEEMLIEEILEEEGLRDAHKVSAKRGSITAGNQDIRSIESRYDLQVQMIGNEAVRTINNSIELFTVSPDQNSLKTHKVDFKVAELMLSHFVIKNKEFIESGGIVELDINPSGIEGIEFCRNVWVAAHFLEVPVELNFKNGFKPEEDKFLKVMMDNERKNVIEKFQKSSDRLFKRIAEDQELGKRRTTLKEHRNIPEVKFQSLAIAVSYKIYEFKNYPKEEILKDKDQILNSCKSEDLEAVNKFISDIEIELGKPEKDNRIIADIEKIRSKRKTKKYN